MNNPELIKAKSLTDESNYEEALKILNKIARNSETPIKNILLADLIKCDIYLQRGLYDEAFMLAKNTYKHSLKLGKNVISVDALVLMAKSRLPKSELEKVQEIINKAEENLNSLTNLKNTEYEQHKAHILFLKAKYHAVIYIPEKFKLALGLLENSLDIYKKLGIKRDIINTLIDLALWYGFNYEIDRGIKCIKEGLKLAKEINNRYYIASSLKTLMNLYNFKGELDYALTYARQSLALFEEINNTIETTRVLTQIGDIYKRKGEFERSLKYLKRSLALHKNLNFPGFKSVLISTLIEVTIALDDKESANYYLKQLEDLNVEQPSKWINLCLHSCKALILKNSLRAKDRVKAEKLYKDIIEEYGNNLTAIDCFIDLVDLLLIELRITNDYGVLKEIEYYVERLLIISEKSNSFWILGETYLLQAKLALIKLQLTDARRLLTEGQNIAEKYNLTNLAMRISNEHDELLKELGVWENFKKTKASLEERMKLSRLSEDIDLMAKKHIVKPKEFVDENPVLILIVSEGGEPIFSQPFIKEWSFENHLFGGFLTAINTFSDEIFSKGLERAKFGDYTVILKSVSPFLIFYLFKGQSFQAQKRIRYFAEAIQKKDEIWQKLQKFYETNQEIQLNDIPLLNSLLNDVFINKLVP